MDPDDTGLQQVPFVSYPAAEGIFTPVPEGVWPCPTKLDVMKGTQKVDEARISVDKMWNPWKPWFDHRSTLDQLSG